jgi:uncharacterized membrane-anchored protein YhcB (DUF1043 family)
MNERSDAAQLVGSLLVALAIVAVAVIVVTAKFGPTSAAEQDAVEERIDLQEERLKEREERLEERREDR